jgi:hypothetical protein
LFRSRQSALRQKILTDPVPSERDEQMLAEKIVLGIAALNLVFLFSEITLNVLKSAFG